MYSRPKPGETEEDLLRLQEEFETNKAKNKIKPAATVVSSKAKEKNTQDKDNVLAFDIKEQLANTFEAIPTDIKLQNISEKRIDCSNVSLFGFHSGRGFPQAKRRDPSVTSGRGSIFSQQIKKMKKDELPMEVDTLPLDADTLVIKENILTSEENVNNTKERKGLPSKSYIISGSDSRDIHEENLNIIKTMTEEEIREEKEKLIATMDPAIVAFLKSKRKKERIESRNPTIKEQNEAAGDIKVEDIETPAELLTQPSAEKWLNFNIIEANKLAWMKDVNVPKIDKSKQFEARFDFEGWLLPYAEPEINEKNRTLYHHGEEPGRPGYTLQELFQLARSSIVQQKIIALNCIANMLSLNWTGVYDDVIDLPIEQIFFVVRFSLDDNTPTVLNASIKAMRNLIFSQIDETCLDSLLGFGLGQVQPVLAVDHEKEDDTTVNDQQLAEKNIIRCLARTDILTRIRYIINTVRPSLETIVYCMDILIRLARDSELVLTKIINCDGLIDSIVQHFVPSVLQVGTNTSAYGLPLLQSIKFLRVVASRSVTIANRLITRWKILDSIILYLSDDTFSSNVNGLRLQTECMHFWALFVNYGLSLEYFGVLQPILLNMLDYHFKNTNLDMKTTFVRQGHVAALLILLGSVAEKKYSLVIPFLPFLLEKCLPKWVAQFGELKDFACGKLQIISSLLYCLTYIQKYQRNNTVDEAVLSILNSKGYFNITNKIRSGSMLLNNYETHKSSSNLKSLEGAAWHTMDHVVPIIQTNSCLPFLFCLTQYINSSTNKLKLKLLTSTTLKMYLEELQKLDKYYLSCNWFTRPESFTLINILESSVSIKDEVDTSIFYELSVKCLCIFNSEQKRHVEYLLENIIFCSKFYPSHSLLQNLDISQRSGSLETSLSNLNEVLEVYTQVLGLKCDIPDFSTACCIDIGIGNVIPMDWIYTPILVLYSDQQQNKTSDKEEQQIFTVKNCLRWILIYETYFPQLASTIDPTDRFCRLACVFLGSDNLFLTKEIHDMLELCFKNVMKQEDKLNFNRKIEGLSNFQDFYTQLLEQYQGVSYGDILFGNVILVPLAQKQNIQYKKTLWSEYMGVVQIHNVTVDQCMCDLSLFLEPPEQDLSLLTCYRRAVVNNSIRKNSVLFKIAKHHVDMFILNKGKNK